MCFFSEHPFFIALHVCRGSVQPAGEDRIFPFRCCGGRMISAPTVSLYAEGVYRAEGISCRKAYRESRRDLYRASVGEDRIFPFRCCGGRMLSAPTDSLARVSRAESLPERSRREHIARCRRISCRKAYRKSRRDLYRIPVGEDRIFPFRCCGGRIISAPTVRWQECRVPEAFSSEEKVAKRQRAR